MHCSYECDHFKFCESIFRFRLQKNFIQKHNKQNVVFNKRMIAFFYVFFNVIYHDFVILFLRNVNIYIKSSDLVKVNKKG